MIVVGEINFFFQKYGQKLIFIDIFVREMILYLELKKK